MKWISHSRDEIKKGTICKRERIHICGLGASVGCERVERTFNTPRRKSQIGIICSLVFRLLLAKHEMINPENEPSPLSFHLRFRKVYLSDVRQDSPQKFHQYIKLAVRSFCRGFLQYKGRINLLDYLRL